jgi:hypothetical protein
MDLTIPIIGSIIALGVHFTETPKTPRENKKTRDSLSANETPSGSTIYENQSFSKVRAQEQELANTIYAEAEKFPNPTRVPPLANTRTTRPPNTLTATVEQQTKEQFEKTKESVFNGPMFGSPYKINNVSVSQGKGLLGNAVESHQNMVPFFGSKVTQNTNIQVPNVVEKFTGAVKTDTPKTEVKGLFAPEKNNNVFGNQALTTRIDALERFGPSVSNNKTKLLPVHQVRVQPLPAEVVKPQFKTLEQLRATSNPKETYEAMHTLGADPSKFQRAELGAFNKNRPETMYENQDRWFTTTGAVLAPKKHQDISYRKHDANEQPNLGPATDFISKPNIGYQRVGTDAPVFATEVMDPKRMNFERDWVRNKQKDVKLFDGERIAETYANRENERDTTKNVPLSHPRNYNKGERVWYDKAKTTIKETNLFEYSGNAEAIVPSAKDYFAHYNTENTTDKVLVEDYVPSSSREIQPVGSNDFNMRIKDNSFNTEDYKNVQSSYRKIDNFKDVNTEFMLKNSAVEKDITERINPALLKSFNENPYTHFLHSI